MAATRSLTGACYSATALPALYTNKITHVPGDFTGENVCIARVDNILKMDNVATPTSCM